MIGFLNPTGLRKGRKLQDSGLLTSFSFSKLLASDTKFPGGVKIALALGVPHISPHELIASWVLFETEVFVLTKKMSYILALISLLRDQPCFFDYQILTRTGIQLKPQQR